MVCKYTKRFQTRIHNGGQKGPVRRNYWKYGDDDVVTSNLYRIIAFFSIIMYNFATEYIMKTSNT